MSQGYNHNLIKKWNRKLPRILVCVPNRNSKRPSGAICKKKRPLTLIIPVINITKNRYLLPHCPGSFPQSIVSFDSSKSRSVNLYPLALAVSLNLTALFVFEFNGIAGLVHIFLSSSKEHKSNDKVERRRRLQYRNFTAKMHRRPECSSTTDSGADEMEEFEFQSKKV